MKCAFSQRRYHPVPPSTQAQDAVSHERDVQLSKLPFKRPQIRGSAHGPLPPSCKKANSCEDRVFGLRGH